MQPGEVFFDAPKLVEVGYRFTASAPVDIRIELVHRGHVVRGWTEPAQEPLVSHSLAWDPTEGPGPQRGKLSFRVGPDGGVTRPAGSFRLRDYEFPLRGPHSYGDRFGVPRSGGRTHEGQDVWANCGTPLVAARGGTVQAKGYSAALYGYYLTIDVTGIEARHLLRPHDRAGHASPTEPACTPATRSAPSAGPATPATRAASSTSSSGRAAGTTATRSTRCTTCAPGTAGASEERRRFPRNARRLGGSLEPIEDGQDRRCLRRGSTSPMSSSLSPIFPMSSRTLLRKSARPADDLAPHLLVAGRDIACERPQILVRLAAQRDLSVKPSRGSRRGVRGGGRSARGTPLRS